MHHSTYEQLKHWFDQSRAKCADLRVENTLLKRAMLDAKFLREVATFIESPGYGVSTDGIVDKLRLCAQRIEALQKESR